MVHEFWRGRRVLVTGATGIVGSWLVKDLLSAGADLTLVWNQTQFDEAVRIHNIPANNIIITGSPFLDKWFEPPKLAWDEDTFRKRVGLPPDKPFVLYLGSSTNIAHDESWLVLKLAESLHGSPDPRLQETMVLVRPHGANQEIYEKISAPNVQVWIRDEALPDSPEAFADFAASLLYSVCSFGLNTTGMVDALLADGPVIALLVEEYINTNVSRAVHFRYLLEAGVYEQVETTNQAAQILSSLMDGDDRKRGKRRQFALQFVRPHGLDRPAGEVAARAIEMTALAKGAAQIHAQIA